MEALLQCLGIAGLGIVGGVAGGAIMFFLVLGTQKLLTYLRSHYEPLDLS